MAVNLVIIACLLISAVQLSFGCSDPEKNELMMLKQQMQDLSIKMESVLAYIENLQKKGNEGARDVKDQDAMFVNTTIEERVTILELQVTELTGDLDAVEDEVILISSDQISQDERILELEVDANGFEESIEELVTANAQLGIDLTDLSDTVADQNVTLNSLNGELSTLNRFVSVLNDTVEQMTLSGSIAFHVRIDEYTSIPIGSAVIFGFEILNIGDGYNSETGAFTVPPSGGRLYFFYTNLWSVNAESALFQVRVNGSTRCRAESSAANVGDEAGCGVAIVLAEDVVNVVYADGTDDTPLPSAVNARNIFTGFRISPE